MKIIGNKDRTRLKLAARDRIPCDLAIENVQLVNVITGEIYPASVDIIDGVIARVRTEPAGLPAVKTVDGKGRYLLPGFIDTHMHVESTMMTPENFGKAAVVWGTTTAVTDPHEIANVMGIDGVSFMLESAEKSPLRQFVLAPSCVPSVPAVEGAGASFLRPEIEELLSREKVIGIAEIMDYIGVVQDDDRMHQIIEAGEEADGFLQGHSPRLSGSDLCAYLDGGPVSDHEVSQPEELIEKLRLGMHVNIKSSSLSDTVNKLIQAIKKVPCPDNVSLCTDDVHAADLLTTGHLNHVANKCVEGGLDPVQVARFGTWNACREYNFEDIGRIAPSCVADLQLIHDLTFADHPDMVFVAGQLVAENGQLTSGAAGLSNTPGVNTVHIPGIQDEDFFRIHADGVSSEQLVFNSARSAMVPGQTPKYEVFPVENGSIALPDPRTRQFVCVANRHGSGDKTIVVAENFHILHGCVASTISHDSHNMTLAYTDPADALAAAKELERIGGGMCFTEHGKVICSLPLPVAGLMSPLPGEELARQIQKMNDSVNYACENLSPMLLAIAILALPVRPGLILTDRGVVNGDTQQFVPLTR